MKQESNEEDYETEEGVEAESQDKQKRQSYTIGERILKWSMTALLRSGEQYRTITLRKPFSELFDHFVYGIAREGRYLGNRRISITHHLQLAIWMEQESST